MRERSAKLHSTDIFSTAPLIGLGDGVCCSASLPIVLEAADWTVVMGSGFVDKFIRIANAFT